MVHNKVKKLVSKYNLTNTLKISICFIILYLIYSLFTKSSSVSAFNNTIEKFDVFGYIHYGNQLTLQDPQHQPIYSANSCTFKFNGIYRLESLKLMLNTNTNTIDNGPVIYNHNITKIYIQYEDGNGNLKYIKTPSSIGSPPNVGSHYTTITNTLDVSNITDENKLIVYTSKIIIIFGDITNYIDKYIDNNGIGYISKFNFWGSGRDMISENDFMMKRELLDLMPFSSHVKNISNYDVSTNTDKFIFNKQTDYYIYGIKLTYTIKIIAPSGVLISTPETTPTPTITSTNSNNNIDIYNLTNNPFKLSILYNNSIYVNNNFNINTNYYVRNDPYIITDNTNTTITQYIFFINPVIANTLEISVPRVVINNSNNQKQLFINTLYGYGATPTMDNINDYKRVVNTLLNNSQNTNLDICPSVDELVNKQNQVQQICDNLEYQDKVKSEKLRLEKNKQYLLKLQEQQQHVDQLNQVIQTLDTKRQLRDKQADVARVFQYQQQKSTASSVLDLANKRLESQNNNKLYLDVNMSSSL